MQRYFVHEGQIIDREVMIEDSDFHHIKNVMRQNVGDQLLISSFSGRLFLCEITEFNKKSVRLRIIEEREVVDNTLKISIAQAMIKKDNFELVLQKCSELGVAEVYPLETQHSIIKIDDFAKKLQRYLSIVKEASEQSERVKVPKIHNLKTLKNLPYDDYDQVLIAYARHDSYDLLETLQSFKTNDKVLVLIGPEGGFSDSEITFLKTKGKIISLGKTILRSETAAIYILSAYRLIKG